MPSTPQSPNDLETQKFEFEKLRYERENRFFNKNFGLIVTSIVSLSAIIVSSLQAYISYSSNLRQIQNEREKSDNTFRLEQDKSNRTIDLEKQKSENAYAFEIAKFLIERRSEITSKSISDVKYIRQIVIASFPSAIASQISSKMRDLSDDQAVKDVWADAAVYAQSTTAPVQTTAVVASPGQSTGLPVKLDVLISLFPQLQDKKTETQDLLDAASALKISDRADLSAFLAYVFWTTDFLRSPKEERGFSQTSVGRIKMIFGSKLAGLSDDEIEKLKSSDKDFFNRIYGTLPATGNSGPDDGYRYRGRGYLQITGRANYRLYGNKIGVDLEANPDLLANDAKVNALVAAAFYDSVTHGLRGSGASVDFAGLWRRLQGPSGIDRISQAKGIYDRIYAATASPG